jgi:hypothetical protein
MRHRRRGLLGRMEIGTAISNIRLPGRCRGEFELRSRTRIDLRYSPQVLHMERIPYQLRLGVCTNALGASSVGRLWFKHQQDDF